MPIWPYFIAFAAYGWVAMVLLRRVRMARRFAAECSAATEHLHRVLQEQDVTIARYQNLVERLLDGNATADVLAGHRSAQLGNSRGD
jgi:hypothetical protein